MFGSLVVGFALTSLKFVEDYNLDYAIMFAAILGAFAFIDIAIISKTPNDQKLD